MGRSHIQGFCCGKTSYIGILLWEKVIHKDFVVGEGHIKGVCYGLVQVWLRFGSGLVQVWFLWIISYCQRHFLSPCLTQRSLCHTATKPGHCSQEA